MGRPRISSIGLPLNERHRVLSSDLLETMLLIAQGYPRCEIATMTGRPYKTVMRHVDRIYHLMGVYCDADLTAYAIHNQLITETKGYKW